MSEKEKPLGSLSEISRALGLSHNTAHNWKATYQDAPSSLLLSEWTAFRDKHGLGKRGKQSSASREQLVSDKLRSEVRLNEIKIAKEERKLIPAEDVESFLLYASSRTKSALFQMVGELAPKLAGLEAAEIRIRMRDAADGICRSMQTAVEDWQREQEEARLAAESVERPQQ